MLITCHPLQAGEVVYLHRAGSERDFLLATPKTTFRYMDSGPTRSFVSYNRRRGLNRWVAIRYCLHYYNVRHTCITIHTTRCMNHLFVWYAIYRCQWNTKRPELFKAMRTSPMNFIYIRIMNKGIYEANDSVCSVYFLIFRVSTFRKPVFTVLHIGLHVCVNSWSK